mgnify:CR=1 FL=1
MKRLLWLLLALSVLCISVCAVELPEALNGAVPQELLDSAQAGDGLLSCGAAYLWDGLACALRDALADSLRGAVSLMLLALLCGLVERENRPRIIRAMWACWGRRRSPQATCARLSALAFQRWTSLP